MRGVQAGNSAATRADAEKIADLHDRHGLPFKDIAERLGKSVTSIRAIYQSLKQSPPQPMKGASR